MNPMPPARAMLIAASASVTVSIAALTMGMFSERFLVSHVLVSTSLGTTSEYPGINKTSSKENASSGGSFMKFLFIVSWDFLNYPYGNIFGARTRARKRERRTGFKVTSTSISRSKNFHFGCELQRLSLVRICNPY
jgi:hypothetical protein